MRFPSLLRHKPRLIVPEGISSAAAAEIAARVRADFRRTAIAAGIALAAVIAGHLVARTPSFHSPAGWTAFGCAVLFVVFGVVAIRLLSDEAARVTSIRAGASAAGPVRVTLLLLGYGVLLLVALDLLEVPLGHLLVGGAITGIILGIAAQQALGNLFAGLVLLFTRPYVPGQRVIVRSGALNGPLEGTITGIGLLYTTLQMDESPTNIPNSALLAAAVGPAPNAAAGGGAVAHGGDVQESGLFVVTSGG